MTRGLAAAALALAATAADVARADRVLVEGEQSATFLLYGVPEVVRPRDYANSGFTQSVKVGDTLVRVDVAVELSPVGSRAPFPPKVDDLPVEAWLALAPTEDAPTDDPAIIDLAADLLQDADTQYEAVTRVVDWVSTHVQYVIDDRLQTGARATLDARKAYCVGMSNLAVSLLRTAGIPARDVHGILAQRPEALSGKPVAFTSAELHRWVEVYLQDVGWVFSDPLRTSHFVDALHVVLYPHTTTDPYEPNHFRKAQLRLLQELDSSYGVDRSEDVTRHVFVRPNIAARFKAAVVGHAYAPDGRTPVEGGTAVLKGAGSTWKTTVGRGGKFSFTGMAQGVYELRLYSEGYPVTRVGLKLGTRELKRLQVRLERP